PYDYVISSMRAIGVPDITNYRPLFGAMTLMGMPPYGHETPDGYGNTREAWLNPEAMMMRLSFATALSQGHLPLLAPPFEEYGSGPVLRVKSKGSAGGAMRYAVGSQKMNPSSVAELMSAIGGDLSPNTRDAIEAAPAELHSALILGSPEFMMR